MKNTPQNFFFLYAFVVHKTTFNPSALCSLLQSGSESSSLNQNQCTARDQVKACHTSAFFTSSLVKPITDHLKLYCSQHKMLMQCVSNLHRIHEVTHCYHISCPHHLSAIHMGWEDIKQYRPLPVALPLFL